MEKSELTIRNCVFSFKCDAKWENMKQDYSDDYIEPDSVRFCTICQKEVFLSLTDEDLARNVKLNRCIAINRIENGLIHTTAGMIE